MIEYEHAFVETCYGVRLGSVAGASCAPSVPGAQAGLQRRL